MTEQSRATAIELFLNKCQASYTSACEDHKRMEKKLEPDVETDEQRERKTLQELFYQKLNGFITDGFIFELLDMDRISRAADSRKKNIKIMVPFTLPRLKLHLTIANPEEGVETLVSLTLSDEFYSPKAMLLLLLTPKMTSSLRSGVIEKG